jgi:uncharacterized UPF0160 family protein
MKFLRNLTRKKNKKLVTHNGAFHADDVFACATISLILQKKDEIFEIIRTRDEKIIKEGDYVFDVGGIYDPEINRYDHHQRGGAGERENKIPFSSLGLVWKKFGKELCGSEEIANRVDKRLIQQIDANDNGLDISIPTIPDVIPYGIYDVIFTFHPNYKEINSNFNEAFLKAVNFARELLLKEIEEAKDQAHIHEYLVKKIEEKRKNPELIVLDEYFPREKIWFEFVNYPDILFLVGPRNNKKDEWKLISLPKNAGSFEFRKSLPESWAGLKNEELQKNTGVSDAIFVHRALFLAITKSKEGALKLAELALSIN